MPLSKTAVFIASRFGEFRDLRRSLTEKLAGFRKIALSPINLDDGNVSHQPPLVECLSHVRRCEFMILLLGDEYGAKAPGSEKSYTHLEYEEAMRPGSGTRVLVFCCGTSYDGNKIRHAANSTFAAWQQQVSERHTIGFLDPAKPAAETANEIFIQLLGAVHEMYLGQIDLGDAAETSDELFEAVAEDLERDDATVDELEARDAEMRGIPLIDEKDRFSDPLQALLRPNAVAAREQREEAHRAIELRDFGAAIVHLKRTLDLKPLDLMGNYWLARIYLALGNKERYPDIVECAERAAKVAQRESSRVRAASCYILAARAATLGGKPEEGLEYARSAVEANKYFSESHLELGRQLVSARRYEQAMESVREAYGLYPPSLRQVVADPAFRPVRRRVDELVREIKERVRRDVESLLEAEGAISAPLNRESSPRLKSEQSLSQLLDAGRNSIRRQHAMLRQAFENANAAMRDASVDEQPIQAPISQESLPFKTPGSAVILHWLKGPGDVVRNGDAIFNYQYYRSRTTRTWVCRNREPMRILATAGPSGTTVTSESPAVYSLVPASTVISPPGRAREIAFALGAAQSAHRAAAASLQSAETELNRWKAEPARRLGFPYLLGGGGLLALSAMALLLAPWKTAAFVTTVAALALVATGLARNSRGRTRLGAELIARSGVAAAASAEVDRLEAELRHLRLAAESARAAAAEALSRFERITLRKGKSLIPFLPLTRAQPGEIVRVKESAIAQYEAEFGRRVELLDDLPLDTAPQTKSPWTRLYGVMEVGNDRILLSRAAAYAPGS